jgi:lipoprotein-anchoring transpeptidase ErfK/SrfK
MPGRRSPFAVIVLVSALLAAPLAVAAWLHGMPKTVPAVSGRFDANFPRLDTPIVDQPVVAPAAPAPAAAADPAPAPAAAAEASGVAVAGSKLRRGVARAVSLPATVADVAPSRIGLYSTPGQAEPDDSLSNPTWEGLPLVFLVQQRQGDWLEVQLNTRPNQTTAWIRAADVSLRQSDYRIVVSLSARHLTLYKGDTEVLGNAVAIGTSGTPTPTGNYYVDGAARPPDGSGPYGPYQLSVAAFSEVLMSFGSGIGQIAMHGTNQPSLIGGAVSNGCIRMANDDITRLANTVPIGTPVQIVA